MTALDRARLTTPSTLVNPSGRAANTKRSGQGNDTTHWRNGTPGQHIFEQVRCTLGHPAYAAGGTKPPAFTAASDEMLVSTSISAKGASCA